jgi:hypothetical protein
LVPELKKGAKVRVHFINFLEFFSIFTDLYSKPKKNAGVYLRFRKCAKNMHRNKNELIHGKGRKSGLQQEGEIEKE